MNFNKLVDVIKQYFTEQFASKNNGIEGNYYDKNSKIHTQAGFYTIIHGNIR